MNTTKAWMIAFFGFVLGGAYASSIWGSVMSYMTYGTKDNTIVIVPVILTLLLIIVIVGAFIEIWNSNPR